MAIAQAAAAIANRNIKPVPVPAPKTHHDTRTSPLLSTISTKQGTAASAIATDRLHCKHGQRLARKILGETLHRPTDTDACALKIAGTSLVSSRVTPSCCRFSLLFVELVPWPCRCWPCWQLPCCWLQATRRWGEVWKICRLGGCSTPISPEADARSPVHQAKSLMAEVATTTATLFQSAVMLRTATHLTTEVLSVATTVMWPAAVLLDSIEAAVKSKQLKAMNVTPSVRSLSVTVYIWVFQACLKG